ncbi:hypothetical protein H0H81_004418, partial [Sphagnurus paluster]
MLFLTWKVVDDVAASSTSITPAATDETPAALDANPLEGTLPDLKLVVAAAQPAVDSNGKLMVPGMSRKLTQVMGYVKILVDIGGSIADVHPYAKAVFTVLTAGQTILQDQLDRFAKVQQLWKIIAETLDFIDDAEPLTKVIKLEKHAQAIMLQLYDSIHFLKEYDKRGFFKNTVEGITGEADKKLDQLISSFSDLK